MAIIQISKIQQRSGNLVDLPQLDEAQFGWANDAKRLFIGATGNTTTDVENVEVLTSYSTISFSQVEGSGGSNVNITSVLPGQILGYDAATNSWINTGGNAHAPNDPSAGIPVHLGTVSNVKIGGGASGYVLETDGAGNLTWTSKGTLRSTIIALSNATPIIMTVANTTPYTNGLEVTISGANAANANTIVNGEIFYVKVTDDFPSSGNVELYTTSDFGNAAVGTNLGTYTANSGIATASLAASGGSIPGGANTQIQYNDGGSLTGSANFTITGGNTVTLTGNLSASNIAGGNLVSANYIAGTLTTAAQPNITSTGTLASLSVSGNANIGNIGTAGLITATGNIRGGNLVTPGVLSVTGNANVGNLGATGNITGGNLITGGVVSASGNATVLGIKTDNYYYANGASISFAGTYNNSNVATFLASYGSNTITTTGNVVVGNISTSGLVTGGNVQTTKYLINSVQTSISAAGSTQETGTALANTINIVSTVSSGNGVVLPTAVAGMTVYITNTSASSLLVYPATGATINELATNAGFTQPSKATLHYIAASSTQWYSVGATYA